MKIVVLGANGQVAQRIVKEAIDRGHTVIGVVRSTSTSEPADSRMTLVRGDGTNASSIAAVSKNADVIVNALSPRPSPSGRAASSLSDSARALIAGATQAGVKRIVVVGGAGSLEVAPGVRLVDAPGFPDIYRAESLAGAEALGVYRTEAGSLDWTYISPAAELSAGERTGRYQRGDDTLLHDSAGKSFISFEDYAVALLDEIETPTHPRARMTVAN